METISQGGKMTVHIDAIHKTTCMHTAAHKGCCMLVEMHEILAKNILEKGACVFGQLNAIVTRAPLQTKVLGCIYWR